MGMNAVLAEGTARVQQVREPRVRRGASKPVYNGLANDTVTPRSIGVLQTSELAVIKERTKVVEPALKTTSRIHDSVHDLRVRMRAHEHIKEYGLLSYVASALRGFRSRSVRAADLPTYLPKQELDHDISKDLTELKKVIERVIVPSLSGVRELFRGRTFEKTAETPKALLLISVPTEKVGRILSFDALRVATYARTQASPDIRTLESGDGRVVLVRTVDGRRECLEFAYQRPGKVDLFIDGKRQGSMWTDDAFKVVRAFSRGRDMTFKKQKRFSDYTVY
jgi:hypothetical protein